MHHFPFYLENIWKRYIRCRINNEVNHRYQVYFLNCQTKMEVQKVGFQSREDEALLEEGGNANVRNRYMRTGLPKFASYSMSNKQRSQSSLSKSTF